MRRAGRRRVVEGVGDVDGSLGLRPSSEGRQPPQRVREVGEAAAGQEAPPGVADLDRFRPDGAVGSQVLPRHEPTPFVHQRQQGLGDRARVRRAGPLLDEQLERADEARLTQPVAGLEQPAAGSVDPPARVHRHHDRQHRQAGRVRKLIT